MALATRCPDCGSVFRVVADQLKLRGGLVRCGQCNAVFDAIGSLSYLDDAQLRALRAETSAPPPAPAEAAPPAAAATPTAPDPTSIEATQAASATPVAQAAEAVACEAAPPPPLPAHAAAAFRELALALAATPALPAPVRATTPDADPPPPPEPTPVESEAIPTAAAAAVEASQESESAAPAEETAQDAAAEPAADAESLADSDHAEPAAIEGVAAATETGALAGEADATSPEAQASANESVAASTKAEAETEAEAAAAPPPSAQAATQDAVPATLAEPEFLRRASQQAQAQRHRKAWAVACVLAAVVLAAQLLMAFRSEVLMRWPQAQPIYAQVCERLGCTVNWPTQSDQIAVLASDLQVLPGRSAYELNVTLRNRAPFPQALPALEVTLTDARGQVITRKVVSAAEYRAEAQRDPLAPGEDLAARLVFETSGATPTGFLVYPFHP